ncbi:hypothetical protein GCM10027160_12620 [Streptomyces calidiresistens]|uniref:Secreted protein n=1 Tax=Streptomyces calidiresistens TaxID=1485586 RepID=A0A7W3T695_9ACTN|nr:hypothetical protein [Streptomyces calidiresistens]MBB0231720.1 hypothetical protein [Streptomyces calidiresistens]
MTHPVTRPPYAPRTDRVAPDRRTAPVEALLRLRAAAATEPGRLRVIGAVLAGLVLLTGALTAGEVAERAGAAHDALVSGAPPSADAARIHRSLAEADTTAAIGFLAGGDEPREVRERHEELIADVAGLLTAAASHPRPDAGPAAEAAERIDLLNRTLPVYTALVGTARADNRRGLPLGGAYLRYANSLMQEVMLPAAGELHALETERLRADLERASARPVAAPLVGAVTLLALVAAHRRHRRRTRRLLNPGLVAGAVAVTVLVGWALTSHAVSRTAFTAAVTENLVAVEAVNEAWAAVILARGDENLVLVARGSGGGYAESARRHLEELLGPEGTPGAGLLARAGELARDARGPERLASAREAVAAWRELNAGALRAEASGEYDRATRLVIGNPGEPEGSRGTAHTGTYARAAGEELRAALEAERERFDEVAGAGRAALRGPGEGAVPLALLGAAAVVLGIGRRLAEYR